MSIRVEPNQLTDHLTRRPFAYIITTRPPSADHQSSRGPRVHVVAVRVEVDGASVDCSRVGATTRRNLESDPAVTVIWPPNASTPIPEDSSADHHDSDRDDDFDDEYAEYTLIADGRATVRDDAVIIAVVAAILHRPATD